MKIGFFDDYKLGVILGDTIVDASSAVAEIPRLGPHDLINGCHQQIRLCQRRAGFAQQAHRQSPRSGAHHGTHILHRRRRIVDRQAGEGSTQRLHPRQQCHHR